MKQKIASFLLFVYLKHIKEDWDLLTPIGRFFMIPAWFISATFTWIISPIYIPQYLIINSEYYKNFVEMTKNFTPEQIAEMRKVQQQNFLTARYGKKETKKFKRK